MAEEQMIQIVEAALRELGDAEEVVGAGEFMPRGHTGSMFAGGLVGDSWRGRWCSASRAPAWRSRCVSG